MNIIQSFLKKFVYMNSINKNLSPGEIYRITPYDFANFVFLEHKIYDLWTSDMKFVHAHDARGAVKMIFMKNINRPETFLYYCVDARGEHAYVELIETEHGDEMCDIYSIECETNLSIEFFVQNLDDNDIVRFHNTNFYAKNKTNEEICDILRDYLML